jgi:hypothetical protein
MMERDGNAQSPLATPHVPHAGHIAHWLPIVVLLTRARAQAMHATAPWPGKGRRDGHGGAVCVQGIVRGRQGGGLDNTRVTQLAFHRSARAVHDGSPHVHGNITR